jgi:hypothetical protein
VVSGPAVESLAQHAGELAAASRDDQHAVEELRAAGDGHRRRLVDAAAFVRFSSPIEEDRVANLANRLLLAAADNRPVEALTPDEDQWLAAMDDLLAPDGYERLTARQPALFAVEQEVTADVEADPSRSQSDEWWGAVCMRLKSLVGPTAEVDDPILRRKLAYGVARVHLAELAGVLDDD